MDAMSLLLVVGETYANLKSLSTELLVLTESGDSETFDRNQRKTRAYFEAPDKIRIEQRRSHVTVCDGVHLHQYHPHANRYLKLTAQGPRSSAGIFQPHSPILNDSTFLFRDIAKWVIRAENLPDESGAAVISVLYDTDSIRAVLIPSGLVFWIDPETHLILRAEGEVTSHFPHQDESRTTKTSLRFNHLAVNQPIPPETFTFTPPEGVEVDIIDRPGIGTFGSRARGMVGTWHSQDTESGGMQMFSKTTIFGIELEFERRLKFSEDQRELHIVERITTPAGQSEHECTVSVSPPATPE